MHPLSSSSLWEEFTIANNQITNTPEQSMFQLFQATQPQTSPDYGGGIPKPSGGDSSTEFIRDIPSYPTPDFPLYPCDNYQGRSKAQPYSCDRSGNRCSSSFNPNKELTDARKKQNNRKIYQREGKEAKEHQEGSEEKDPELSESVCRPS